VGPTHREGGLPHRLIGGSSTADFFDERSHQRLGRVIINAPQAHDNV
jgi:hypothetical protein